jgi:hypothetical protein
MYTDGWRAIDKKWSLSCFASQATGSPPLKSARSPNQRRTLQLYFFEGYTIEEISIQMGQPPGNVRNHYYRALEKIRKLIFTPKVAAK